LLFATGAMFTNALADQGIKVCVDVEKKTYKEYDGQCKVTATLTLNSPLAKNPESSPKKYVSGTHTANAAGAAKPTDEKPKAAASKACDIGFSTHFVIGDSFNDLNFLDTSNCNPAPAKGAQLSWSRDGVAANRQWSVKGAVAEKLIWLYVPDSKPTAPYVNLFAVAPVVNFQRVVNSNAKLATTQNVDVLSYGFSGEALVANVQDVFQKSWQVYVRARALANSDFEGNTKSWSGTFEVEPLSDFYHLGSNIQVGSLGYIWIYPLARAQYFQRVNNSTDPIFSGGNEVFRAGPAVSVSLIPQPTTDADPNKPRPAPQWILNLTYSWYRDFLHGQDFAHWNPSFTYNITDNVGLSLGYEKGKIETNGKDVDLATVSLTVKN
jgi:hypothetical protein